MPTFITGVSLLVALLISLLGTFFNCIQEDETGKRVYSPSGLPVLTKQGKIILVLLILSFGTSLCLAWEAAQQNKDLTAQLNSMQNESSSDLRKVITQQIAGVGAALARQKSLIDEQEKTGQQIDRNLEKTAASLDQDVVDRLTNVDSLAADLIFEGSPRVKDEGAKLSGSADSTLSFNFCSQWMRRANLFIPAGSTWDIRFIFHFVRGDDGTCTVTQEFDWGPADSQVEESSLGQPLFWDAYLQDLSLSDSYGIHVTFGEGDFRKLNPYPSVVPTMNQFAPEGDAALVAYARSDQDSNALAKDLDEVLPRRIAIAVLPNEVGSGFAFSRTFDRQNAEADKEYGIVYVRFTGMPGYPDIGPLD